MALDPADHPSPEPIPGAPVVHGRDLVPLRRRSSIPNTRRERLFAEEDHIRRQLQSIDQHLLNLAEQRQTLLKQLRGIHEQLRPAYRNHRGRRRRHPIHEEPLPPTAPNPTLVIGRELRAICLTILRQAARALSLRDIHAHLHRLGYAIAHPHPTKALADALGHETDHQRCTRPKRGHYAVSPNDLNAATNTPSSPIPDW